MSKKQNETELTRRDFIKTTGVTTAGLVAASLIASEAPPVNVAPGRVSLGFERCPATRGTPGLLHLSSENGFSCSRGSGSRTRC